MNYIIYGRSTVTGGIELEFISNQTLVNANGERGTNGVIVSHVPAASKTFVLIGAVVSASSTGGDYSYLVDLRFDGTVVEGARMSSVAVGAGYISRYPFITKGRTLIGDGIISVDLNITDLAGTNNVNGTIYGYTRDT